MCCDVSALIDWLTDRTFMRMLCNLQCSFDTGKSLELHTCDADFQVKDWQQYVESRH